MYVLAFFTVLMFLFSLAFCVAHGLPYSAIFTFLQPIFAALMILFLRNSIISFYKSHNSAMNFLHPDSYHEYNNFQRTTNSRLSLFFYNLFSSEKKFLNYCETDGDTHKFLNDLLTGGTLIDAQTKPYYLHAMYNIRLCIFAATITFACTVLSFLFKYLGSIFI